MAVLTIAALLAQAAAPIPALPDVPSDVQAAMPIAIERRMATLYDEACLQAFPIDSAVDTLMAAKGATPLTPEQVKVTLVDDPGRGWSIKDGEREILVFLELPPFHACSVRRFTEVVDPALSQYRPVTDAFEKGHPGFTPMKPYDADRSDIHVHAVGEQRMLPGGGAESLFVFDQHVIDPERRAKGDTAINLRFVHQIKTPQ
ncbi:hypothetical protein [uncultured Sphingomonas sp.]|uniref:hypothetical protein n=1 Tax=uncultured Sphingomonas sp. TaxID=158754 RepID=UPI0035CA2999